MSKIKKSGFIEGGFIIVIALGFISTLMAVVMRAKTPPITEKPDTFEECKAAGFPIMESYPEQCRISDGTVFTRKLTDEELKNKDMDKIKNYEDCTKAGYPTTRSYPGKCITPDGRNFIQEIK